LNMLRPVLLYLFCDPNYHLHFAPMRATLLDNLLVMSIKDVKVMQFLVEMVDLMKLDNKNSIQEIAHYINKVLDWNISHRKHDAVSKMVLIMHSVALHQVKYGFSASRTFTKMSDLLDLSENDDDKAVVINPNVYMVMLQKILAIAPHVEHQRIVNLATRLLGHVSHVTAGMIIVTCLQSLPFPTHLPGDGAQVKAELVRLFYKTSATDNEAIESFKNIETSDSFVREAQETVKLISVISKSPEACEKWLNSLIDVPHSQLASLYSLLSSIFFTSPSTAATKLSLQLLLEAVKADSSLSTPLLSLILHKLASDTKDPESKLALLHALPLMAADRNCISLILKLVSSLSSKPSLAPLRLNILYKLWKVEARAYPFLQKAIQEPVPQSCALEFQTAQAVVIRDILRTHASQLGSDLLPVLSNILNQCSSPEGATACCIAIEGIKILCKHSVIDMKTTIKVLSPKCSKDRRPSVLSAYIKLLGLAATFKLSGSEYHSFLSENVKWLWQTASSCNHVNVVRAAYESLGQYPLEMTQLKMLPSQARLGLKLPSKYCATPCEAARKPEDVLPYVPSECWGQLLSKYADSELLIRNLIKSEVANLPRAVYSLSQSMQNSGAEPVNFCHLPEHSVLRGIVQWCQDCALARRDLPLHPSQLSDQNKSLKLGLSLLAADYDRPLPPLDWGFLEPFFVDGELRSSVISLLCQHASSSRTAKMIVERQLRGEQSKEGVMCYIEQLYLLVASISQQTIAPWLTKSLQTGLHAAVQGESTEEFVLMLQCVRAALQSDKAGEVGQLMLAQAIETIHDDVPTDNNGVYEEYLSTASLLPVSAIERLSSPSVWWEVTPAKVFKAAGLRSSLALTDATDTPLTWLNEIIDVVSKQSGDHSYLLRQITKILFKYRREDTRHLVKTWMLELMGQIASLMRTGGEVTTSVMFLMDVFTLTIILLTETESLVPVREDICMSRGLRLRMLPVSVSRVCQNHTNMSGQLADWTSQLYKNKNVTSPLKESLGASIKVFKDSGNWKEATMWGKLVMIK